MYSTRAGGGLGLSTEGATRDDTVAVASGNWSGCGGAVVGAMLLAGAVVTGATPAEQFEADTAGSEGREEDKTAGEDVSGVTEFPVSGCWEKEEEEGGGEEGEVVCSNGLSGDG